MLGDVRLETWEAFEILAKVENASETEVFFERKSSVEICDDGDIERYALAPIMCCQRSTSAPFLMVDNQNANFQRE